MTNPYAPATKAHAVAAHILAAHAAGRWVETAELRRRTGASVHLIAAVRARLRDEGLVGRKGDYAVCHICGEPAVARDLCSRHYQAARPAAARRARRAA